MLRNDLPAAIVELEHATIAMPDHIGTWHALHGRNCCKVSWTPPRPAISMRSRWTTHFRRFARWTCTDRCAEGPLSGGRRSVKVALRLNPQCVTAL